MRLGEKIEQKFLINTFTPGARGYIIDNGYDSAGAQRPVQSRRFVLLR